MVVLTSAIDALRSGEGIGSIPEIRENALRTLNSFITDNSITFGCHDLAMGAMFKKPLSNILGITSWVLAENFSMVTKKGDELFLRGKKVTIEELRQIVSDYDKNPKPEDSYLHANAETVLTYELTQAVLNSVRSRETDAVSIGRNADFPVLDMFHSTDATINLKNAKGGAYTKPLPLFPASAREQMDLLLNAPAPAKIILMQGTDAREMANNSLKSSANKIVFDISVDFEGRTLRCFDSRVKMSIDIETLHVTFMPQLPSLGSVFRGPAAFFPGPYLIFTQDTTEFIRALMGYPPMGENNPLLALLGGKTGDKNYLLLLNKTREQMALPTFTSWNDRLKSDHVNARRLFISQRDGTPFIPDARALGAGGMKHPSLFVYCFDIL